MSRAKNVQTPGVEPQPEDGAAAGTTTEGAGVEDQAEGAPAADPLPPDVEAMINQRVDQRLAAKAAEQRRAKLNPATGRNDLPTQEEALARVQKDPKHRAILSKDGWVTAAAPVKERDQSGFAKA